MKIVAALGGNALLLRGEKMTAEAQRANIRKAVRSLAGLIAQGHDVIITHGNGPQVGLIALQSAAGPAESVFPLDVLGAESEGMIGYLIEQEMRNALPESGMVATSTALIVCIRFSAWSKTIEAGDSKTSSVTSMQSMPKRLAISAPTSVSVPWKAGRQCMNFVKGLPVSAMTLAVTR